MNHVTIGTHSARCAVFAHGWARSHHDFIQVAEALEANTRSVLLDLPGFGDTPRPGGDWGSSEYADHCAAFIRDSNLKNIVWVGHSFGGRVGLQLAVRHPQLLSGLVLVAGAGVPLPVSAGRSLRRRIRQFQFKLAKYRASSDNELAALEKKYGSSDYVQSKEIGLRDIFIKVISEDQSQDATKIQTPTRLIYGERDTETPVAVGQALESLIPDSQLVACPEFGHIDILSRGRHQVALAVNELFAAEAAGRDH